jgi:hypothetical protein
MRSVSVGLAFQLAGSQVFAGIISNTYQGGNGNWSDGLNWSAQGPPQSFHIADIANSGTITMDTDPAVFGMKLTHASAILVWDGTPRTISVTDDFVWGSGQIGTNVTVNLLNNGSLTSVGDMRQGNFEINGTFTHGAGAINAVSSTSNHITVGSSGVYDAQLDGSILTSGNDDVLEIRSGGRLRKSSGTGATVVDWLTTNSGTIEVVTGTLRFNQGGRFQGDQAISNNAVLHLNSGTFSIADRMSVDGAGTFDIDRSLDIGSGTNDANATVDFGSSGVLTGSGVFNANSNVILNGGDMEGTMTLNLNSSATHLSRLNLQDNVVNVRGSFDHSAGAIGSGSGFNPLFTVHSNAVFDLTHDGTSFSGDSADRLRIEPGGTLKKSTGTGTGTITWGFTNLGAMNVQSGTLNFDNGGRLEGTYSVSSGAILGLNGGSFTIADRIAVAGDGTWNINGPLDLGSGTNDANIAVTFPAGGDLAGSGVFNANRAFTFSGGDVLGSVTLNLFDQSSFSGGNTVSMENSRLVVHSNLSHSAGSVTTAGSFNSQIHVMAGGTYDLLLDGTLLSGSSEDRVHIFPGGTIRKSAGTSISTFNWGVTNQGALDVQSGTLRLNNGGHLEGTQTVASGARLELQAGTFTMAPGGSVSGAGVWDLARTLDVGGNTNEANIDFELPSTGVLTGAGFFNANSNFTFEGGDLEGTLSLNLMKPASKTSGAGMQNNIVNIHESLTHSGGAFNADSGFDPQINVLSNALYDFKVDGSLLTGGSSDKLRIFEGGTLRKSAGTSTTTINWGVTNLGLIEVQSGTLALGAGARLEGTYAVASGATLRFDAGTFSMADQITIDGAGLLEINQPLSIGAGTNAANIPVDLLGSGDLVGSGEFYANETFALRGGDLEGTLTLNLNKPATVSGSTAMQDTVLNVHSNLSHVSGSFAAASGFNPLINVLDGGVYDMTIDGTLFTGTSSDQLRNHVGGTIRKSAGSSFTSINWGLTNLGTIEVQAGTLRLNGGARLAGNYSVASGAVLNLEGGNFTIDDGISVDGGGTWDINRQLDIGANNNSANTVLDFNSSGVLTGSGTFNANSNTMLDGGDLEGTLTLNLNDSATHSAGLAMQGNTLNIRKTLSHTGGSVSAESGFNPLINVHSNAVYELRLDGTLFSGGASDMLRIRPGGTLRKSVGTSTTTITWGVTNLGTIDVQSGNVSLAGGARLEGAYSVASGARLQLDGGSFTIADGVSMDGAGELAINRTLDIGTGGNNANIDVGFLSSGVLTGSGVFNANSNVVFNGGDFEGTVTVNLNDTATHAGTLAMQDNVMNVRGSLTHSAASITSDAGFNPRINVANNALYDIRLDGTVFTGDAADSLVVEAGGTLRKSIGGSTTTINWGVTNAGTIESQIGILSFGNGLTQTDGSLVLGGGNLAAGADIRLNGGTLSGHGLIDNAGDTLNNNGATVKPGASPGTLSVSGSYVQGSGGTLEIEIDGSQGLTNDLLAVTGGVTLGGTLGVTMLNGTVPTSGNVFTIVSSGTGISGTFANAPSQVTLTDGSTFDLVYDAQEVRLQNFQPLSTVTNAGGSHNWNSIAGWVPQQLPSSTIGAVVANPGSINLNVSPTIPSFTLANASATVSGNNTITAIFNWAAGDLGSGTKIVASGGDISGGGVILDSITVAGNLRQSGGTITAHGSLNPFIRIQTNGVYDLRFDGNPFSGDTGDRVIVDLGGRLKKSSSTGRSAIDWFVDNSGTIVVESGELAFIESGSIGGASTVSSNAVLHLDLGSFSLLNGGQVSGAGEFKTTTAVNVGAGVFTVNSPAILGNNTTLGGSGRIALAGGGTVGDGLLITTGIADVRSRVFHTNGVVTAHGSLNPRFLVSTGGILEYPDDSGSFSGDSGDIITNGVGGIIRKSGGTGISLIDWAVHNNGAVAVQTGTLRFNEGGSLGGSIAVATNAVLLLDNGTFNLLDGGTSTGAGRLLVSAPANVPSGATYDARSMVELVAGGGLGGGGGVFAVNDRFNIVGGNVNNGGSLDLNGAGTVTGGAQILGTININGSVSHTAGQHVAHGAFNPRITIRTNGVYSIDMNGSAITGDSSDQIVIEAGGVLRKAVTTGEAIVDWNVVNQGVINVSAGTLSLVESGTLGGAATVSADAVLHLDLGTFNLLNGGQINGAGEFRTTTAINVSPGVFTVNNPAVLGVNTTLGGSGTIALAGGGTIGGGIVITTGKAEIRSRIYHTNGSIVAHGSFNPSLVVSTGGILEYPDESGSFSGNSGDFIINSLAGTIRKSGGTGTNLIDWAVLNTGSIEVQTGGLLFNEGGSIGGSVSLATNAVLLLENGVFSMLNFGSATGGGSLIVSATANVPSGSPYNAQAMVELLDGGGLGGGSGVFAVNGPFAIRGGTVNDGGSLDLNGAGTVTGGAQMIGTVNVNGTVVHTAGQHVGHGSFNPRINIRSNGIYSIEMDGTAITGNNGDTVTVDSGGTLRRDGTAGEAVVDWNIVNRGAIDVRQGSLSFVESGSIGGVSTVSGGALLHLDTGSFTMEDTGRITGAGEFKTTASITLASGAFEVDCPAVLTTGTSLGGSGALTLTSGGTVGGGLIITTGTTDVRSRVFHTNGLVVGHASFNPRFVISANGILEYPDETGGFFGNSGDYITNHVGGFIRKSAGTGTNTIDWAVHNAGTIDVQTGALLFNEGGNVGGNLTVASGTRVILENGTFNMLDGGSSTGAGTLVVSAPAHAPAGATYGANSRVELVAGGGLGGGAGIFAANGSFDISGGTVNDGGSLDLNGTGTVTGGALLTGTINVNGTVVHSAGQHVGHGSFNPRINVRSNGVYNVTGDGSFITGNSSDHFTIQQGGVLRKSAGAASSTINWQVNNGGVIESTSGTLQFILPVNMSGGFVFVNGGDVKFAGDLNLAGGGLGGSGNVSFDSPTRTVFNDARVRPGTSPGVLSITGNYQQGSVGQLEIEVGGTVAGSGYDVLQISGSASLGGSLNVTNINSFGPQPADVFTILTATGGVTGSFANTPGNVLTLPNGDRFEVEYAGNAVRLRNFAGAGVPPSITAQPQSQLLRVGNPLNLTVNATGSAPLLFQWLRDGNPVAGATNAVLTRASARLVDGGTYHAVVSNGAGSATSTNAVVIVLPASATAPDPLGLLSFGGTGADIAEDVTTDGAGNVYLVGGFTGSVLIGTNFLTGQGEDAFVAKVAPDGAVLWAVSAGGAGTDLAAGVAVDGGGNVYVVGDTDSSPAQFGSNSIATAGGSDAFVAKYSSTGQNVWVRRAGGVSADEAASVAIASDGVIVAGTARHDGESGTITFGSIALSGRGNEDGFVAKYDSSGGEQWARLLGGSDADMANGVVVVDDAAYVAGGYKNGGPSFDGGVTTVTNRGGFDVFVARFDASGVLDWVSTAGGSADDVAEDVQATAGTVGTVGYFHSTDARFGTDAITNAGSADAFLWGLGTNGQSLGGSGFGGAAFDQALSVVGDPAGNILLAGEFNSRQAGFGTNSLGTLGRSGFLARFTTNMGRGEWAVQVGERDESIHAVATGPGREIYVAGHYAAPTLTIGGSVVTNTGANDVFLARLTNDIIYFVSQPVDLVVNAGASASFGAVVEGEGPIVYRWFKGANPLSSQNAATLAIAAAVAGDAGAYTLMASNLHGSVSSSTATLTVNVPPGIISQPGDRAAVAGAATGFSVTAVGTGPLFYQWRKNGADIGGATNASFTIFSLTGAAAGTYSVVVSNAAGTVTSANANLTVLQAPAITNQPQDRTVIEGAAAGFAVTALGTPLPGYLWRKNGGIIAGETNASLSFAAATAADAGVYSVTVSNAIGSVVSANATLTVIVPPVITGQPQDATAFAGSGTNLVVITTGSLPRLFQWRKDGANIPGATNASLAFGNLVAADGGTYSVVVSNTAGTVTSGNATLTVIEPPVITGQPQSLTVSLGADATFTVAATGAGPLDYRWRKDGTLLPGETNASLVISNVTLASGGGYQVRVSNVAGSVISASASLTPVLVPVITEQPQSRVAREGASLIFRVAATGATGYQWRKDGASVVGATNTTLTLTRVSASSAGIYSVVVANPTTNTVSSNATLVVSGTPKVSQVGNWPEVARGEAFDVHWANGLAYVASGPSGLKIFGITNGNTLVAHGSLNTDGSATAVQVVNGTAYLADGETGLKIIDVSDSFHPRLVGFIDTPIFAQDVFAAGNHAYVADLETGMLVVDVSNPATPLQTARYDTAGRAEGIFISGDHAFIADMAAGLHIVSVTNPAAPVLLGTLDTVGFPRSVQVSGSTAYVADWTGGLRIVNVANPATPTEVSQLTSVGLAYDVRVLGGTVYVAAFNSGLHVVDAGNMSSPSLVGTLDTAGLSLAVDVSGTTAFVADWTGGLQVLDVATPASPSVIAGITAQGSARAIRQVGQHAYLADFGAGLQIVDVSDPTAPAKVGQLDTAGSSVGLDVTNNHAYVADYDQGLLVIDVSNAALPVQRGNYDTPGFARDVHVWGNHAYVADDVAGLQVIDVSTPTAPSLVGSVDTSGSAYAVQVSGNYAFVADFEEGLKIYSITNPAAPVLIGSANTDGEAWDLFVSGNRLFLADGSAGLKVFGVSDPTQPVLRGSVDTSGDAVGISVSGDVVTLADFGGGVRFFDISNPASPTALDSFANGTQASGIQATADYAYVASRTHGLSILNMPGSGGFAPLITRQPENQSGTAGNSIFLLAEAAGSPVLLYQWQKDGVDIGGGTNRGLVITNSTVAAAGNYRVSVSNDFGSVISLAAVVSVDSEFNEDSLTGVAGIPGNGVSFRSVSSLTAGGVMRLEIGSTGTGELTPDHVGVLRVQVSSDLINWTTLTAPPTAANGVLRVNDPDAGREPCRFYRVIRQ